MAHRGLTFGIFLAPFHRLGENPTLAIARDVELIQWLDYLGYDEAWIGEHHSAGWELIASPELIIAAAAEKTKHIKLGSGVTSLPYHHPFLVAQRWVQLDHMTRGRAMLGCGPGALTSDAYMLGIEPATQRPRMLQSMDAIMQLLKMEDRVTIKTDWFEMNDARLHLAPYSDPHFEIAVASTITPFGMIAAGTHGVGVLSIGAGLPGGPEALASQWKIAEDTAAKHGKTVSRKKWRVVVNAHIAEDDEQALNEVRKGERNETITYFEDTLGRPPGRSDDPLSDGVKMGTTLVGSPETVAKGIKRPAGIQPGRVWRHPVPRPRMGHARADDAQLRTVRPLRHAGVPAVAGRRWDRGTGRRKPQAGVWQHPGSRAARLHRFRRRGPGGFQATHPGRARCIAPRCSRLTGCRSDSSGALPTDWRICADPW